MRIFENDHLDGVAQGSHARRECQGGGASVEMQRIALDPGAVIGLQSVVGNAGVTSLLEDPERESPVKNVLASGGQALDDGTRTDMEARFGADFSGVRVHTGPRATESAQSVQAHAYTVGENVVFQDGHYQPGTTSGDRMLAHELTHVLQQRSGPVAGTDAPGGIKISDPSDEFERAAEANAERVMSSPGHGADTAMHVGEAVQRQEAPPEEDEEVQGTFVQRQEASPEEDEMEE